MGSSTKRVVRDPHAFHSRCSRSPPCPSCLHPIYFCPAPSAPIAVCPPSLSVPRLCLPLSPSAPSQLSSLLSACSEPLEAGLWGCIVRPLRSWTAVRFIPWEAPEGDGRWEKRRSWGGPSLGPPGRGGSSLTVTCSRVLLGPMGPSTPPASALHQAHQHLFPWVPDPSVSPTMPSTYVPSDTLFTLPAPGNRH